MRESDIIALFAPESPRGASVLDTLTPEKNSPTEFALPVDAAAGLDDCARVDSQTIVTTDTLVEQTHFRLDWSGPEDLAIKLWNVNLSDIAASGGEPEWCLLNLGVPAYISDDWLRRFAAALRTELRGTATSIIGRAEPRPVRLLGGDTFRAPHLVLTLTLAGRLPARAQLRENSGVDTDSKSEPRQITRSGGRAGDAIYVTGEPGLSLLGYEILSGRRPEISANDPVHAAAVQRHLRPRARLDWSRELRAVPELHSMLDVSDGLYADLIRLTAANPGLRFEIDWHRLPLPTGLLQSPSNSETRVQEIRELVLASGEELELLFTAPSGQSLSFPCTEIGRVLGSPPGQTPAGVPANQKDFDTDARTVATTSPAADPADRVLLKGAPWRAPPRWFQHF